ncbi:MAG: UDP-glucose 6-dehydrogenase, partial [Bryobacteraceae bacterium]
MNVTILGTGYVGLTTGACLAFLGHKVTCVDVIEQKIAMLERGEAPFHEPHLADLLAEARCNLKFTTDYAQAIPGAQAIFIAVGTPPGPNGAPDLHYLEAAARGVGEHLGHGFTVVVNKSTVPIGSGNWVGSLVRDALEGHSGRKAEGVFAVASNP